MDLLQLLLGLKSNIEALQAQLVDAEASAAALAQAKYDEGFAAGVASVPANDKVYTQAEVDAKIQEAVLPLQEQIVVLQGQVEAVGQMVEQAKLEAVAAFKAELLVKYQEQQVVESQAETGFADLLK